MNCQDIILEKFPRIWTQQVFTPRFWGPGWIEQVSASVENYALTRFIPVWVCYTLYKDIQGNVKWDLLVFIGIKLDWVWWARRVRLRAVGTSFMMWLCPQTDPQSISPGTLKPAATFTTQFLCCVPCDFLLILALLPVLLHSAGYLGAPAPNFPNNLIPWLPLTAPLLEYNLNLTLSWTWSLASSLRERPFSQATAARILTLLTPVGWILLIAGDSFFSFLSSFPSPSVLTSFTFNSYCTHSYSYSN